MSNQSFLYIKDPKFELHRIRNLGASIPPAGWGGIQASGRAGETCERGFSNPNQHHSRFWPLRKSSIHTAPAPDAQTVLWTCDQIRSCSKPPARRAPRTGRSPLTKDQAQHPECLMRWAIVRRKKLNPLDSKTTMFISIDPKNKQASSAPPEDTLMLLSSKKWFACRSTLLMGLGTGPFPLHNDPRHVSIIIRDWTCAETTLRIRQDRCVCHCWHCDFIVGRVLHVGGTYTGTNPKKKYVGKKWGNWFWINMFSFWQQLTRKAGDMQATARQRATRQFPRQLRRAKNATVIWWKMHVQGSSH